MDISKYPLEKLFYVVAGVIPGFVALLIYQLAVPGAFHWFFALGFLGYKVRLGLILLAAFIVGNTLTTFFSSVLAALGGAIGAAVAAREIPKLSQVPDVAPWRDARWRALAKNQLGAHAPDDTSLMSQLIFDQRCEMVKLLPEDQRLTALANVHLEKGKSEIDDMKWEQWYDHYHQVILQPENRAVDWYVQNGFNFSLQTTALYVLVSALFVPAVRNWWCIVPACIWLLLLAIQTYSFMTQLTDKWSTLSQQIRYLSGARA